MAYGSVLTDVVQSSTTGTPPQFNDGSGVQVGTLCRAWVNFNGVTTATIRASFNVSSVTRTAAGFYTVNFTNALADANYAVNCSCNNTGFPSATYTGTVTLNGSYAPTTTATQVQFIGCQANNNVGSGATGADISYVMVTCFR